MNRIEQLFDDFFNASDEIQVFKIIKTVLSSSKEDRAQFFHLYVSNLQYSKKIISYSLVLSKEQNKYEELGKKLSGLRWDE